MTSSWALDFSSSLYLGLEHPARGSMRWERLTLGKPAALETPPGTRDVERDLATLTGCQQALLAPSTLHLYWDLFGMLARRNIRIFLDAGAYPIAYWGVERAASRGTPVEVFRQHDLKALRSVIAKSAGEQPVIVADGYCPSCGAPTPIAEYLECVKPRGGMVVIDDTQSLGIFGHSQGLRNPYGIGGGGSLQRQGVRDHRVVVVSSLAKAFGAPVAVLAGADHVVATFDRESETRMHCSPPSIAVIAAASRALSTNRLAGDAIRRVLGQRVTQLRSRLRDAQVVATKDLFPVQSLRMPEGVSAGPTYEALLERGIRTVLHRSTGDRSARLSFIIRATHGASEIEYAAAAVLELLPARAIQRTRRSEARCQASY